MDVHTGYAKSDNAYLGYSVAGRGPDLLYVNNNTIAAGSLDEEPHAIRYFDRFAGFSRLIRYDVRGVGTSDPLEAGTPPTVERSARDAVAVLDAVGSERAVIVGEAAGGLVAMQLAVDRPDRVAQLALINSYACLVRKDDYRFGFPEAMVNAFLAENTDPERDWQAGGADDVAWIAPSLANDRAFRDWWARASQRGAGPATARAILAMNALADVRDRLGLISAPTLVLHRIDNGFVPALHGEYLAANIAGARYVGLPGADHHAWTTNADDLVDEIEEFVTGRRSGDVDRVLKTIVFTDIVDSTGRAAALGDRKWRALLDAHDAAVRVEIPRFGGTVINTTGDGFLGAFDSPTQAVQAGGSMVAAAARVGVAIRVGIHTGECERRGEDLAGLTVHIAARVAALGAPGEVLVSRTVRDLVGGTGLRFVAKGEHDLKGVPDPWQLFALES